MTARVLAVVLTVLFVVSVACVIFGAGYSQGHFDARADCLARELASLRADVADVEARTAQVQARAEALSQIAAEVSRTCVRGEGEEKAPPP